MKIIGIVLVIGLAGLYAAGIREVLRVPFRALGILVAGMAFHNVVIMALLRLNTPHLLVRVVQAWKEGILLLLGLLTLRLALAMWSSGRRPRLLFIDWLMAAFTVVILVYAVLPSHLLHSPASFGQRLLGLRVDLYLPLLYLYGRVFWSSRRADLVWVGAAITGAAAAVGVIAVLELWLIPTRLWLDFGVNQFSAWLGFTYHGPKGLPENFFQTTSGGLLLRRAVSTYISPLGIAYTGLLVIPLAVAFALGRRQLRSPAWLWFALVAATILGVLFSLTRLAIFLMVVEIGLLALLYFRAWLFGAVAAAGVAGLLMLYAYPQVGPLVSRNLQTVHHPHGVRITSTSDPSLHEHASLLGYDLEYVILHPLGTGLGSSVHRYGPSTGTGESAIFDVFGDLGVLGGLLYLPGYVLMILVGIRAFLRARSDPLLSALPLVASVGGLMLFVITLTSDVWSDLSVTFLFWWAAGYSATVVAMPSAARARAVEEPPQALTASL